MQSARFILHSSQKTQVERVRAFVHGLETHGWDADVVQDYCEADLVCMWGVRRPDLIERAKLDGATVCILELGYVGNRREYTSVSFGGGLNGRAQFRGPLSNSCRWKRNFSSYMKEYDTPKNGYALIMGQMEGDVSVQHVDIYQWYTYTAQDLFNSGWADIRFRPHPDDEQKLPRLISPAVELIGGDLEENLKGAGVVVTFNSNSGVNASLYGRPVLAFDQGSMVYDIAGHSVDDVKEVDRKRWAHALAWKQWTVQEMSSGQCWEAVGI